MEFLIIFYSIEKISCKGIIYLALANPINALPSLFQVLCGPWRTQDVASLADPSGRFQEVCACCSGSHAQVLCGREHGKPMYIEKLHFNVSIMHEQQQQTLMLVSDAVKKPLSCM